MANQIAKKQHYVPKFYLKEFATNETYGKKDKAQIHIYDLKKEEKFVRNIKTVAYERYLYSPQNKDHARSSYMEDKLADVESLMSKIWKDFANTRMGLSPSMKKGISLFIATLILRHPDNLHKNKEMKKFLYTEIVKHIPNSKTKFTFSANGQESIMGMKDIKAWRNASQYDESIFFVENIEYLAKTIADKLLKKKWSIIVSEEKVFITTDRPVIISNSKTGLLGVASPGVIISFPISPTRLLVLEDNATNEKDLVEYPLNKGHAPFYNSPIWSNAYRYIIGHRDTEEVIDEIYNYQKNNNVNKVKNDS